MKKVVVVLGLIVLAAALSCAPKKDPVDGKPIACVSECYQACQQQCAADAACLKSCVADNNCPCNDNEVSMESAPSPTSVPETKNAPVPSEEDSSLPEF